ncbi:sugar transferase [Geodermatophilus normandii]|uniref:Sugar transferase n=1 Tax=Geodermatophilus normandii TaxID=1137989 RepID=A0A6P0GFA5_9ACTN|nr:sugar transferase [Geodermatophilus normandii]
MHRRFLVKPGLTGWWRVSGRSDLPWDDSVPVDVRYVETWSLTFDSTMSWRTFGVIVRGSGACCTPRMGRCLAIGRSSRSSSCSSCALATSAGPRSPSVSAGPISASCWGTGRRGSGWPARAPRRWSGRVCTRIVRSSCKASGATLVTSGHASWSSGWLWTPTSRSR